MLYPMDVNQRIRKETKKLILEIGKTQKEVAKDLGVSTQYLNEMLNTEKSGVPKRWKELLEYLRAHLGDERAAQSALLSLLLDDE
jgi:transcriptional regulator with XRE-family HTH domain